MSLVEFDCTVLGGFPVTVQAEFCSDGSLYDWIALSRSRGRARRLRWLEARIDATGEAERIAELASEVYYENND